MDEIVDESEGEEPDDITDAVVPTTVKVEAIAQDVSEAAAQDKSIPVTNAVEGNSSAIKKDDQEAIEPSGTAHKSATNDREVTTIPTSVPKPITKDSGRWFYCVFLHCTFHSRF